MWIQSMRVYHFSQEIKMINKNLGTVNIALDEYERVFILKVHQKDSNQFVTSKWVITRLFV